MHCHVLLAFDEELERFLVDMAKKIMNIDLLDGLGLKTQANHRSGIS